jgi:4-carboxymuconolactone decarboxylase
MKDDEHRRPTFPPGEKTSPDYFSGTAWVNILVPQDETGSYAIGNVLFEPRSRNHWHKHPAGQILLVTDGKGYYQERGKPAKVLTPGDIVIIPSDVEHWHGAAHDSSLTHIVITNNGERGPVQWLDPVTDEEYERLVSGFPQSKTIHLTEAAMKNHEELFPNHHSALKMSDPELIEVFDNFAFDEVLRYGNLDSKTRVLLILGSTIASQALQEYRVMLGAAFNVGITPVEIKEVLYQSVPYVGIAKVFDFIHATNDFLRSKGVFLPLEGQSTTTQETRYENGLNIQKRIFGELIDTMYQDSPKDLLHIQHYLSANCFGDYYTRGGLDLKTRELLTFAMLLSLGGAEQQVKGHVQGNVNMGNDRSVLLSVITQLLPYIGYPRALTAIRCVNELLPE